MTTTTIEKVIYRAHATATGGREGQTKSSDGALDVKLSTPKELGARVVMALTQSSSSRQATRPAF
ncbi:hypothetical protein HSBAA_15940 [Vreelandella sulfidaeris]|uniref:Organic hydroperoxide resistance protein n=1 Tax=Vreelandella sulfidaeris TaxID=115553 RepID=A0A455U7R6_9GAMM|nr:hypothetical protein HSBAA_15940 [Halomonas sulfidaeris]